MPLAGHDLPTCFMLFQPSLFQSTCPLRGTTRADDYCSYGRKFQSTCPLRGTTRTTSSVVARDGISIHMPLAGHDPRCPVFPPAFSTISIHVPLAGHDRKPPCVPSTFPISIHVPLAGHDVSLRYEATITHEFQSTCPWRGTTLATLCKRHHEAAISIHVPLAGHDRCRAADHARRHVISIHVPLAGHDYIRPRGRRWGW